MRIIEFDIYNGNKALIKTDLLPIIREKFSVVNKNARFVKKHIGRSIDRIYSITPSGRFDIGLFRDIKKVIDGLDAPVKYVYSDAFKSTCIPQFPFYADPLPSLGLTPYDYQATSVEKMLRFGRGVILIGTGGGKTFIMSLFTKAVRLQQPSSKFLIVVPTIQLVEQTYSDFIEYGFTTDDISKWSGDYPYQSTDIIVASTSILQSKSSDLRPLLDIDVLLVDEVHVLKKGNSINKVLDKIPTHHRYGFTGTMPEETIDQWNVRGKIGSILFEKNSDELRGGKFISEAKIDIIKIHYNMNSLKDLHTRLESTPTKYISELEFMIESNFRNKTIMDTAVVSRNNTLIMVDRIAHGELFEQMLNIRKTDKQIYFIQGDVAVDEREKVRDLMEQEDNIICIAISKIFSTGINIKNIHNIIFATPGKAKVKLIQSIGRGLRLHESKDILRVYDFADNLHYSNKHLSKREILYSKEKLNYDISTVKEPNR